MGNIPLNMPIFIMTGWLEPKPEKKNWEVQTSLDVFGAHASDRSAVGSSGRLGNPWLPHFGHREPMFNWEGHLVPVLSDHPGHLILMDTLYRLYISIPYKLAQLWHNRLQQHPFCCHLTAQPTRNGEFMAHVDLYRHRSVYISIWTYIWMN